MAVLLKGHGPLFKHEPLIRDLLHLANHPERGSVLLPKKGDQPGEGDILGVEKASAKTDED